MGYFKSERHYVNYIKKLYSVKFDAALGQSRIKLFRQIYQTSVSYSNVFKAFNLKLLHETVSWKFKHMPAEKDKLKKFYSEIIQVLKEIELFIADRNNINTDMCKTLLNYCSEDGWFVKKELFDPDAKGISDSALSVLESLSETPGVYFIYNNDKEVIYIGKSYDLKSRIPSSIKERKGHYFSYIITNNRIDADILEPYLIGITKPILNGQYLTADRPTFKLPVPEQSDIISVE